MQRRIAQRPAESGADKEQKRKCQTKPHKDSPFSILFPVYSFFLNTNEIILYETVNTLKKRECAMSDLAYLIHFIACTFPVF